MAYTMILRIFIGVQCDGKLCSVDCVVRM